MEMPDRPIGPELAKDFNERARTTMDFLPGGYTFTHIIFWTVVALVAVGTNIVPIMLMVGLALLGLESAGKE